MTEPTSSGTKRKRYITGGVVLLGLLGFLADVGGAIDFVQGLFGGADDAKAGGGVIAGADTTTGVPPAPSGTGSTSAPGAATPTGKQTTTTLSSLPQPTTPGTPPSARSGPGWFDLTAYESVSSGNGFYTVNSINIGTGPDSYPNSFRASYPSSASNPNNRRVWLLGGKCTRLSVWVGKDASSSKSTGTGRFSVKAEDVEIRAVDATMTDAPQHIDLDITGVVRLTLFDTRGGQDANNAWGSPRVQCTAPLGKAR